jgi:hypothetical protein
MRPKIRATMAAPGWGVPDADRNERMSFEASAKVQIDFEMSDF